MKIVDQTFVDMAKREQQEKQEGREGKDPYETIGDIIGNVVIGLIWIGDIYAALTYGSFVEILLLIIAVCLVIRTLG